MSTAGEFADVVGSTLEGQSEDAQVFSAKIPQRPTDLAQESLPLLLVNRADFLQESEVISSICSDSLECRNILGETGTAIADARTQEALPMRESLPTPSLTCSISAPTCSQMFATAFTKEIFIARNALEACLISSALLARVRISRAGICAFAGLGIASLSSQYCPEVRGA